MGKKSDGSLGNISGDPEMDFPKVKQSQNIYLLKYKVLNYSKKLCKMRPANAWIHFIQKHKAEINNIGIACTGRYIMTASQDTEINVWNLKGEILATLDTQQVQNYYTAVSPCGRFIGTSGALECSPFLCITFQDIDNLFSMYLT